MRLVAHDVRALSKEAIDYMLWAYNDYDDWKGIADGVFTYGQQQFCTASVYEVKDDYIFVKTKNPDMIRRIVKSGTVYMLRNGKLNIGSFEDISVNDRVVIAQRYDKPIITLVVK